MPQLIQRRPELAESEEERKWPAWVRHLFVVHIVSLFVANVLVPAELTAEILPIAILMWLPLFVFAGYYFERPSLRLSLYRKIYLVLAIIAIFFNIILAIAFIE